MGRLPKAQNLIAIGTENPDVSDGVVLHLYPKQFGEAFGIEASLAHIVRDMTGTIPGGISCIRPQAAQLQEEEHRSRQEYDARQEEDQELLQVSGLAFELMKPWRRGNDRGLVSRRDVLPSENVGKPSESSA